MSTSEKAFLEICKRQLEQKFSFGNGNGHTQKDLELLSNYIEAEKGVYISLSTLKRLWKNDFKQGPQLATLNALASVLDYENWQDFKLSNKEGAASLPIKMEPTGKAGRRLKVLLLVVVPVVLALLVFNSFKDKGRGVFIKGPVLFTVDKTVAKGVPNTAIFEYDLSNVVADSFFIQQSWNTWRREAIQPNQTVFSSVYYESGYHRAKLIANDSIIAMQPVHILSDGWEPHVYYSESDSRFIGFQGETFVGDGQLQLPMELLEKKKVDTERDFVTRVIQSRDFGVSSNTFEFKTSMKLNPMTKNNCPWMIIQLVTEKHIFYVKLVQNGCETFAAYKLGEIVKRGKSEDLTHLGEDLYKWQDIGISVEDKTAEIRINDSLVYTERFKEDFGDIKALSYVFDGTGSIDFAELSASNGEVRNREDFER
ncbi:hypothetical protein HCU67_04000 [Muricauda sp. DJ-13]|uniref:Uncharacterized protein n=2 Tax=Croceivirga thetidis TaxID=2721623 RepID=A0ABX1GMH1_9FLAO|nr:hypothetical protein [Croceivirga thetidis]